MTSKNKLNFKMNSMTLTMMAPRSGLPTVMITMERVMSQMLIVILTLSHRSTSWCKKSGHLQALTS